MKKCDFCTNEATKDGKTVYGPWANMCEHCFGKHGVQVKGLFTTLERVGKEGREPYSD